MAEDITPSKAAKPFRKGALVRVNKEAYDNSLEKSSSDNIPPKYLFEGPGELLVIKGDYGQVRWRKPVPDVWLRIDHLEAWQNQETKS